MANEYQKIDEVAKKIYIQLNNNFPSEELECLNLSEKEIDDLQNMLNIKLAVLEKNVICNRLMNITKYSSIISLYTLFIYIPLKYLLKNCHDDECYHELLNSEAFAVLACLGVLAVNVGYVAINYNKLNSVIKDMPENSLDIINKLLIKDHPDWFKKVLKELKNT